MAGERIDETFLLCYTSNKLFLFLLPQPKARFVEEKSLGFTETIIALPALCTGCRACEVACSFRRTKKMAPFHASIRAQKNDLTGRMEITIKESCDVCQDQLVPFCLQVCQPRALSLGRKMG